MMGDEEGQGTSDSYTQSYDTGSTATDYSSSTDQSSSDGSSDSESQSGASPLEALFGQAGAAYSSGDYATAISIGEQIRAMHIQATNYNDWGRAMYGLVMSYDANGQLDKAGQVMQELVNGMGGHLNMENYRRQLSYYTSSPARQWDGDFLLF